MDPATAINTFETLVKAAHDNSKNKGFWGAQCCSPEGHSISHGERSCDYCGVDEDDITTPNHGEKLMLIVSELAELFEAIRKGKEDAPCDKDCNFIDSADVRRLTNTEEELADVVIRVMDYAGYKGIDLGRAILSKMLFNTTREHMHGRTC